MTNQEILTKAIEKAIEGGWEATGLGGSDTWQGLSELERHYVVKLLLGTVEQPDGYMMIIFNHKFAKALWGEEVWEHIHLPHLKKFVWQYHLQQMVIADDPIKYLEEHI